MLSGSEAAYLNVRLAGEANQHESEDRDDVVVETGPVVDLESCHEGSHQHEKYRAGSEDGAAHQQYLVSDVRHRNVVVNLYRLLGVHKQVHDVGDGRRHPSATLVIKLVEPLRCVGVSVRSGRVFHAIPSLQQQSAQPTVFSLIVLHVMSGFGGAKTKAFHKSFGAASL